MLIPYLALAIAVLSLIASLAALGEAYAKRPAPRVSRLEDAVADLDDAQERIGKRFRKLQMRYNALLGQEARERQPEEDLPESSTETSRRDGESVDEWRKRVMIAVGPLSRIRR
ncbi:MAG: hypothetical protein GY769_23615 [bacterium]|nr:hypothetical protein [bacterium]